VRRGRVGHPRHPSGMSLAAGLARAQDQPPVFHLNFFHMGRLTRDITRDITRYITGDITVSKYDDLRRMREANYAAQERRLAERDAPPVISRPDPVISPAPVISPVVISPSQAVISQPVKVISPPKPVISRKRSDGLIAPRGECAYCDRRRVYVAERMKAWRKKHS
jgi:hypothetical protein